MRCKRLLFHVLFNDGWPFFIGIEQPQFDKFRSLSVTLDTVLVSQSVVDPVASAASVLCLCVQYLARYSAVPHGQNKSRMSIICQLAKYMTRCKALFLPVIFSKTTL